MAQAFLKGSGTDRVEVGFALAGTYALPEQVEKKGEAAIRTDTGATVDVDELLAWCRDRLAGAHRAAAVHGFDARREPLVRWSQVEHGESPGAQASELRIAPRPMD